MALAPRPAKFRYLEHHGLLAFAHRGGALDEPENTMPAFESTVRAGYSYVETDVHCTSDGVLLAFHDDVLDRVTDRTGRIAELPYTEVKDALVEGKEPIPKLEDILGSFPKLKINIDPKNDNAIEALSDTILRTDSVDRVCVASFSDRRTHAVRKRVGETLCTSPGPWGILRVRLGSLGVPVGRMEFGCLQIPTSQFGISLIDKRFIDFAHKSQLQVHIWTIDDADTMNDLINRGVDGIMTDRKDVLKTVLQSRGLWSE